MLSRSRIVDAKGARFETPLLVPALSSKALGPVRTTEGDKAVVVPSSIVHSESLVPGIGEALLVSAYDIFHELLSGVESFEVDHTSSPYAVPEVLFIDSGWYELSVGPPSGQFFHEVGDALPFVELDYRDLVSRLDPAIRGILTSWDSDGSYEAQIEAAQSFFADVPAFGSNVILKPVDNSQYHSFENISGATAGRLRAFDIVGVAEKDLGISLLHRLESLWNLRQLLDQAGVTAPIHVFGGLDPLMTPLYYAAGGEIFDGLGWLRYAYRGGMSMNRDCVPILDRLYEKRLPLAISQTQLANLDEIAELSREMKVFAHNGADWSKLRQGEVLRPAFDALLARVKG